MGEGAAGAGKAVAGGTEAGHAHWLEEVMAAVRADDGFTRSLALLVTEFLTGGYFYSVRRFDTNGALEATFGPSVQGDLYSMVLQPDGKILLGGNFTALAGPARTNCGRLNLEGTLDCD